MNLEMNFNCSFCPGNSLGKYKIPKLTDKEKAQRDKKDKEKKEGKKDAKKVRLLVI